MNIKAVFKEAIRDRGFIAPFIATGVVLVAILILGAINIRPSELQVPIRNTVFGIRHTYQEQWYNELSFIGFALLITVLHTLISIRLYTLKDRRYAIAFQWLSAFLLLLGFFVFISIFKVISVVQ